MTAGSLAPAPPQPPQGWYSDPDSSSFWRWWSGDEWAMHRCPRDPLSTIDYAAANPAPAQASTGSILESTTAKPAGAPPTAGADPRNDLRTRVPAQSLMEQVVRLRDEGKIDSSRDGLRQYLPEGVRSWYAGALGERRVASILNALGPEWTVLHSVPVGSEGSDIDHVLIGPAGVYTINTKHHAGKDVWVAGRAFRVNNHPTHYISNAAFEARRAQKLLTEASGLTVEAAGLIVVVGVRQLTVKAQPNGGDVVVGVVRESELIRTLQSRRIYSDEQVQRIVDAAVLPETWSSLPTPTVDQGELEKQFEAIRTGVAAGEKREKAWDSAGQLFGATPHKATRAPTRRAPRPRPSRKRRSVLPDLIRLAALAIILSIGLSYLSHLGKTSEPVSTYESAEIEQTALSQAAGTAASVLNQLSPAGVRPAVLTITEGSLLTAPDGTVLVALPAGTSAQYIPSADALSYTLTLTGAQFGTVVTVSPEAGVVPAPVAVP